MRLHDAALASSGSVSLELAAASTPSVIVYKSSWLTGVIAVSALGPFNPKP